MDLYYSLYECCISKECRKKISDHPERLGETDFNGHNVNSLSLGMMNYVKLLDTEEWQQWIDNCLELDLLLHAENSILLVLYFWSNS